MTALPIRRASRYALVSVCLLVGTGASLGAMPVQAATSTITCGPKNVSRVAAPGVGKTATLPAASAGSVTVLQSAQANLTVHSVAPASGWRDTVLTASGQRVHVGFSGTPSTNEVRFYARINSTGTVVSVITVVCT